MKLSAVLLAGGESRRMGRDKAMLLFQGEPLWQRQLNLLRQLNPEQLLISARTDPPWRPADVELVRDAPPPRGPLGGLAAVFAQTRGSHLLALAVDMPFMTEQWLRALVQTAVHGHGVIAELGEHLQPLAAIYPAEAHADFVRALDRDELSMQTLARHLIKSSRLRRISVLPKDELIFRNLNEPEDLSALE